MSRLSVTSLKLLLRSSVTTSHVTCQINNNYGIKRMLFPVQCMMEVAVAECPEKMAQSCCTSQCWQCCRCWRHRWCHSSFIVVRWSAVFAVFIVPDISFAWHIYTVNQKTTPKCFRHLFSVYDGIYLQLQLYFTNFYSVVHYYSTCFDYLAVVHSVFSAGCIFCGPSFRRPDY